MRLVHLKEEYGWGEPYGDLRVNPAHVVAVSCGPGDKICTVYLVNGPRGGHTVMGSAAEIAEKLNGARHG